MLVIAVDFKLGEGAGRDFIPKVSENARVSLALEPGCRQFDVCIDPDDEDHVFLYEIYDDEAAFDAHLHARHFTEFDEVTRDMVARKTVKRFVRT